MGIDPILNPRGFKAVLAGIPFIVNRLAHVAGAFLSDRRFNQKNWSQSSGSIP